MRIWKLKDEYRDGLPSRDLICVEMGDQLLFIQEEGTYDLAPTDNGMPSANLWDVIAGGEE